MLFGVIAQWFSPFSRPEGEFRSGSRCIFRPRERKVRDYCIVAVGVNVDKVDPTKQQRFIQRGGQAATLTLGRLDDLTSSSTFL